MVSQVHQDMRLEQKVRRLKKLCYSSRFAGGVPEWLKGADCKSVGLRLRWFESSLLHQANLIRYMLNVRAAWLIR